MKQHKYKPESLMMSYGYNPDEDHNAVKPPLYQTSAFTFKKAGDGKDLFQLAYGLRNKREDEKPGFIYSRISNPGAEILEKRLTLWDKSEDCAVFESGMAAISTTLLAFLKPGDLLLYSNPLYGGTTHFIEGIMPQMGIHVIGFGPGQSEEAIIQLVKNSGHADKLAMIFIETPANPTNHLVDIRSCNRIARLFSSPEKMVVLAVDNTFLGPVWQHPIKHGADLVLYSATKFIGGHSDLIAGACLGSFQLIGKVKEYRSFLGNIAGPNTIWLLLRSLETMHLRMEKQAQNAYLVADFLKYHPLVEKLYYLGSIDDEQQQEVYLKQCESAGAIISFDIKGGEKEAFVFLNNLKLIKLAVSLGSTESLAQHPATMTHAGVPQDERLKYGITGKMVRLSIGIEDAGDLIFDVHRALDAVAKEKAPRLKLAPDLKSGLRNFVSAPESMKNGGLNN